MNTLESFGKHLKLLREENKLSQEALADKLGISKGALSYYEHEKRTPDIIILDRVAKLFKVTPEYLLGHTSARKSKNISACKQTGLSEDAVNELSRLKKYKDDSLYPYLYTDLDNCLQMMDLINILIGTRYETTNINGENVSETYFSLIMQAALQYVETIYVNSSGNSRTEKLLNNAAKWEAVEIFKDFLDKAAEQIANDLKGEQKQWQQLTDPNTTSTETSKVIE